MTETNEQSTEAPDGAALAAAQQQAEYDNLIAVARSDRGHKHARKIHDDTHERLVREVCATPQELDRYLQHAAQDSECCSHLKAELPEALRRSQVEAVMALVRSGRRPERS